MYLLIFKQRYIIFYKYVFLYVDVIKIKLNEVNI